MKMLYSDIFRHVGPQYLSTSNENSDWWRHETARFRDNVKPTFVGTVVVDNNNNNTK